MSGDNVEVCVSWFLAWSRLALTPSISHRRSWMGKRPSRHWREVERYATERKEAAKLRLYAALGSK